jgi:hypothetical protein
MGAGKLFNFLSPVSSSGVGTATLSQSVINIVESNTGSQVNKYVNYTEVDFLNGVPSVVRKYVDSTKVDLVYTITLTFSAGILSTVQSINHDDGFISTKTFTWVDGNLSVNTVIT